MKLRSVAVLLAVAGLLFGAGCGKKPRKEITDLERKQAELLVSEAQFAMTLRDWTEAEGKLAQAVGLCDDVGDYWIHLGRMRMRLGKRDGAKDAYHGALAAFEREAAKEQNDPDPQLQQVHALALLGRLDDARALLTKIAERFPHHPQVRAFVDRKQFDQLIADSKFKEVAL